VLNDTKLSHDQEIFETIKPITEEKTLLVSVREGSKCCRPTYI